MSSIDHTEDFYIEDYGRGGQLFIEREWNNGPQDDVSEDAYLFLLEGENLLVNAEGQPFFQTCSIMTPQQWTMFRFDPDKYDEFRHRNNPRVTIHLEYVPEGDICCDEGIARFLDIRNEYGRWEQYERQTRKVVGW
jgi:hypothetical protein